jgi:hypothetical protein
MAAAAESSPGASTRAGDSTTAEAPRRGAASTSGEGWSAAAEEVAEAEAEEVAEAEAEAEEVAEAEAEAEDPTRGASACLTDPSPAWFATRRR